MPASQTDAMTRSTSHLFTAKAFGLGLCRGNAIERCFMHRLSLSFALPPQLFKKFKIQASIVLWVIEWTRFSIIDKLGFHSKVNEHVDFALISICRKSTSSGLHPLLPLPLAGFWYPWCEMLRVEHRTLLTCWECYVTEAFQQLWCERMSATHLKWSNYLLMMPR